MVNLNSIKAELQRMRCAEHNQAAKIRVAGDTLHFECCCEAFKTKLDSKLKTLMANAVKDSIDKEFKRIFK